MAEQFREIFIFENCFVSLALQFLNNLSIYFTGKIRGEY